MPNRDRCDLLIGAIPIEGKILFLAKTVMKKATQQSAHGSNSHANSKSCIHHFGEVGSSHIGSLSSGMQGHTRLTDISKLYAFTLRKEIKVPCNISAYKTGIIRQ